MKHTIRKAILLGAVAALALASVGCANNASEPTANEPEAPAAQTVKIGFAAPLTGDNAVYGEGMKRAVELAIEEANASQAAQDAALTFEIAASDDAGDPKQAVNVANALAGDDKVLGVVGHFNSGCSIPAAPVYAESDLAMVSVSSNPQLTAQGLPNVNRIVAKDDAQGGYAGELARKLGFENVAIVDDSTPYGQGLAAEFKKAFTSQDGKVVAEEKVQPKEVDFSALVTKVKGQKPDVVYYAGAHTEGALLRKQMMSGGLEVPVMGGEMLLTPEYIKIAGKDSAEGDIATSLGLPLDQQPKGIEFKSKYEDAYGKAPEAYDSYAYDCAWIIINAVLEAGPDRAAVMSAVRSGTLVDGVTGTVAFDANGDNKEQIISASKVTDGEWKQIVE